MTPLSIWTIGHSTHTAEEFQRLLKHHDIELVADVRRFPGSRRLPQFGSAVLEQDLRRAGISYHWIPALGGRRRTTSHSANSAWRNASFQAYADHIATEEFAAGLEELLMLAGGLRTAVMCAEALWWRCHRRLIADVLVSRGIDVLHIMGNATEPHRIAPPARIVQGALTYVADDDLQERLELR
jgi:uncharacterized protein (DUF488 family)